MPIINPLFQSPNGTWETAGPGDPRGAGNQIPKGWTLTVTQQGALMPWPAKNARGENGQGIIVDARADGPGEYAHKLVSQLPLDEIFGKPRALLILQNTNQIYKCFGGVPNAVILSQKLTETPGTKKQYSLFILGETPDVPTPPNIGLEQDHFRARFAVGGVVVESHYGDMRMHKTIADNERSWNTFFIPAFTFPASGEAQLTITLQQNWPGGVDFFIAGIVEETITTPPGDGGTNPPDVNDKYDTLTNLLTALEYDTAALKPLVKRIESGLDVLQAEVMRLRSGE